MVKKKYLSKLFLVGVMCMSLITPMLSSVSTYADTDSTGNVNSVGSEIGDTNESAVGKDTTQGKQTEYQDGTQGVNHTEIYMTVASQFDVVIPKTVILDGVGKVGAYSIKLDGDIPGTAKITVVPDATSTLHSEGKDDIIAEISQVQTEWVNNNLSQVATGIITANGATAGVWKGNLNFNINYDGEGGSGDTHIHNWVETITKEATCTTTGIKTFTCSCGATKTQTIPAKGHNYVDGVCSNCGAEQICSHVDEDNNHLCDKCGQVISSHVDTDKDHNCDTCGEKMSEHIDEDGDNQCDYCGAELHQHNYVETITKNPTCIEEGEKTYTCDSCGDTYTEAIPVDTENGHDWESKGADTASEQCSLTYLSSDSFSGTDPSKKVVSEVVNNKVNIKYNGGEQDTYKTGGKIVVSFTVPSSGYYTIVYDNLEENTEYSQSESGKVSNLANTYFYLSEDGKTFKQDGIAYFSISNYNYTLSLLNGEIPSKGLYLKEGSKYEACFEVCTYGLGSQGYFGANGLRIVPMSSDEICKNCGQVKHTHKYSSEVTKEATCAEEGVKTFTCSCGDSYTESIHKTSNHTFVDGTCSVCGTVCGSEDSPHKYSHGTCTICGAKCTEHNIVDGQCTKCGWWQTGTYMYGGSRLSSSVVYDGVNPTAHGTLQGNQGGNAGTEHYYKNDSLFGWNGLGSSSKNRTLIVTPDSDGMVNTNNFWLANHHFHDAQGLKRIVFASNGISRHMDIGHQFSRQDAGYCFANSGLKEAIFENNNSTIYIATYTFKDCTSLEHVRFETGTGLLTLCGYAFQNCSNLKSIELPNNVSIASSSVFTGVPSTCKITYRGNTYTPSTIMSAL